MNVASLDLCKELYELSGWATLKPGIFEVDRAWRPTPLTSGDNYRLLSIGPNTPEDIPAYDLGYLLRKLPSDDSHRWYLQRWNSEQYAATYQPLLSSSLDDQTIAEADTPEDAACRLAIELFKAGVLIKEGK